MAPFWDDINVTAGGHLFFRLTTNETLLHRIGIALSAAFRLDFSPSTLLIATWDRVQHIEEDPEVNYYV